MHVHCTSAPGQIRECSELFERSYCMNIPIYGADSRYESFVEYANVNSGYASGQRRQCKFQTHRRLSVLVPVYSKCSTHSYTDVLPWLSISRNATCVLQPYARIHCRRCICSLAENGSETQSSSWCNTLAWSVSFRSITFLDSSSTSFRWYTGMVRRQCEAR